MTDTKPARASWHKLVELLREPVLTDFGEIEDPVRTSAADALERERARAETLLKALCKIKNSCPHKLTAEFAAQVIAADEKENA